jgi:hypothetical protein
MPSGNNRTGRKIPKTAGSGRAGEDFAGIGIANCKGEALRTVVRMRSHRIHHEKAIAAKPHAQMANKTAGTRLRAGKTGGKRGAVTAGLANGAYLLHHIGQAARRIRRSRPPRKLTA